MECKRFREWLTFREPTDAKYETEAREHAGTCPDCARLLAAEDGLEKVLKNEFRSEKVPERLRASVALIAEEPSRRNQRPRWPWLAAPGAALTALALLLVVFAPFGQRLTSIEGIARLAEQNHLAGYAMEFRAGEIGNIAGWFRDKLPFEVVRPDLAERGLELLGGRKCSLGQKDIAYLFYEQTGKRYSLFQLDAGDVKIDLEEGQSYRYPIHDCVVEVWKEGNRVYVLIA